ncbi:MFS transporter, CP family, cyanate transporter [Pseudomonas sp. LAMO17WK12:I8]|jgi:CP family cyanate transporter-like MFS transporter|nr:CP family cyanate transporter-like MFS transporter [Pseudomonas sp. URMO17WK12:I7]SMF18845.1 MFS transporter, CP family, cyanate transporter [Pseudomonas sp. URMO17WK12:I5]SNB78863.1 MFS transporter, CP family, cyanate transporter [Pseudomonas sp. URIL14HWK12:I8]SNS89559.1 MFS transporter, CP family, cyanate transporter [Pseudomonas sp. LAMO17WK12:I8]SNY18271.1 MFS transporter, CP family, cyanate transporter [Pseudomonas sp. LAMO17WK12:I12]SNY19442.1 MFS transporter, CP family, cyanate tran
MLRASFLRFGSGASIMLGLTFIGLRANEADDTAHFQEQRNASIF